MSRIIVFALLLMLSTTALANELAVMATRFTGVTLRDHESFTFLPSEVVTIRQHGEKQSLVESYSRDWATTGGVFVPNEALAFLGSFRKIDKWAGEKSLAYEAGDYDVFYKIDSTGAFKARNADGHLGESGNFLGHLYKSGNILWARPNAKRGVSPSQDQIFLILPGGELCWPFDTCNPAR